MSFADGDSVSEGTKLVEFELKDLERNNQKAELNVKSGEYDYKNSINKSNQADQKQKDAKSKVATLEQQVKDKQNYLASLKSQLSAVQSQAAADAQAAAQAQAAQAAAEAQAKADAQAQAEAGESESLCRCTEYISDQDASCVSERTWRAEHGLYQGSGRI